MLYTLYLNAEQRRALRLGAMLLTKELKKAKKNAATLGADTETFDEQLALLEGALEDDIRRPGLVHNLSDWERVAQPEPTPKADPAQAELIEEPTIEETPPWEVEESNAGAYRVVHMGTRVAEIYLTEKDALARCASLNGEWRAVQIQREERAKKEQAILEERAQQAEADELGVIPTEQQLQQVPAPESEETPSKPSGAFEPAAPTADDELYLWTLRRHYGQLINGEVPAEFRDALLSVRDWDRYRAVCKDFGIKIRRTDFEALEDLILTYGTDRLAAGPVSSNENPEPATSDSAPSIEVAKQEEAAPAGDFAPTPPDPSDWFASGSHAFYIREAYGAPGEAVVVDRRDNSVRCGPFPPSVAIEHAQRLEKFGSAIDAPDHDSSGEGPPDQEEGDFASLERQPAADPIAVVRAHYEDGSVPDEPPADPAPVEVPEEIASVERAQAVMKATATLAATVMEVQKINALLWHALHSLDRAGLRWEGRRQRGISDLELQVAIMGELGEDGRGCDVAPFGSWRLEAGGLLVAPSGQMLEQRMRGDRLRNWTRVLLEIPQPAPELAEVGG